MEPIEIFKPLVIAVLGGGLFHGFMRLWPYIIRWKKFPPWKTTWVVGPKKGLETISKEFMYWKDKLGRRIFVLRLLPFEITKTYFKVVELESEDYEYDTIMKSYKKAISDIVKEGSPGDVDYWDGSIFGRSRIENIDKATEYSILGIYFPLEIDPMDIEEKGESVAETSALALTSEIIKLGIFMIGKFSEEVRPGDTLADYINKIKWKIAFSLHFNPDAKAIRTQWLPKKIERTTSKRKIEKLSKKWLKEWETIGEKRVRPPLEKAESVKIDADNIRLGETKEWRKFVSDWYS